MKTVRLECGLCAVFSEIYLRQIPSVDKIQISKSKEAVMMTYKPGGTFQPAEIRTALKKTEVGVAQFQIGARGTRFRDRRESNFLLPERIGLSWCPVPLLQKFLPAPQSP